MAGTLGLKRMQVEAVILAGGGSHRFGPENKLLVDLCGKPVLAWSIAAFAASASIERIILVAAPGDETAMRQMAEPLARGKLGQVVAGGERRRDSVEEGLRACRTRYVAIHDGARPLVTTQIIEDCVAAAATAHGAIAATPVTDTIKRVRGGVIVEHPERSDLWAAQTPQVVLRRAWLDAAGSSDNDETDDAAMLARLGLGVRVVDAGAENIKITRPLDVDVARAILKARSGQ
jgi:2-C-methyl-D-erythritol 4-phosphate cytidylyltransferase